MMNNCKKRLWFGCDYELVNLDLMDADYGNTTNNI